MLTGTLAVDRRFKKEGEQSADFLGIVIWNKAAESTANYCGAKGDRIEIVGRLQSRSYKNKEDKTVYVVEVVAEEVTFANDKKKNSTQSTDNSNSQNFNPEGYGEDITPVDDGDIPF